MSIPECFPMRKRRHQNTSRTPKRSPCETGQLLRRTPRRINSQAHSLSSSQTEQSGLEIIWDNQSPSPGRVLKHGKRKKAHGSDSSSGGEISELVKKLADQSGTTPEANPLLKFWMCQEGEGKQQESSGRAILKQKSTIFQTPARKPRRAYRRSNRTKVKQLTKELELLAHHINEPEAEELLSENAVVEERRGSPINHVQTLSTTTSTGNTKNAESALPDEAELFDVWESDGSEDLILSQVDMSALCNGAIQETQSVFTQTQTLSSEKTANCAVVVESVDAKGKKLSDENYIVTEAWDLVEELGDSDGEEFLQTALEDFEKSQSVLMSKNKTPSNACSLHVGFEKGADQNPSKRCPSTHSSKSTLTTIGQYQSNSENREVSHMRSNCRKNDKNLTNSSNSRLKNVSVSAEKATGLPAEITRGCAAPPVNRHGEQTARKNQMPGNLAAGRNCSTSTKNSDYSTKADHWTGSVASERKGGKTLQKYTKEDIERKRMLAQQKRKQKLEQFPKRKS